jgi:tetrahydromethanopterin S-methyltransferase subunit H
MDNKVHTISQGTPCHLETIAEIVGKSQKHIRDLSKNGHIPSLKKSLFPDGFEAIKKYIIYLDSTGSDEIAIKTEIEKLKKISGQARKEVALATKHENNSVNLDIVEEIWCEVGNNIRSTMIASVASLVQDLHAANTDKEKELIITKNFESILNKLSDGSPEEILKSHEKIMEEENEDETEEDNE